MTRRQALDGGDLVADLLAACDRWGPHRALRSAPRRGAHIRTLTYEDLGRRIRSTAEGLRALGLAPGDRVLFSVRPGPDAVVLALGILLAGGTVVFADPGAGEALFRARTALAAPRWVAAESLLFLASTPLLRPLARRRGIDLPDYSRLVPGARHLCAGPWLPGVPFRAASTRRLASSRGSSARRDAPGVWRPSTSTPHADAARAGVDTPRSAGHSTRGADPSRGSSARRLAAGVSRPSTSTPHADAARAGVDTPRSAGHSTRGGGPDDEALIVFTSGTTDAPRAVVHTRGSLAAGLGAIAAELRPGWRVLTDQLMVGIPALLAGAHWTLPPPGLDPGARPEAFVPLLADADVLFAAPAAMDALLRALGDGPAPELETVVLGGAPVLRPLLERIRDRFPRARIRAVYGMTELLPVAIADGEEKLARADADGDWVGRLVPGVTARLDDGELVLAGPGLASYLGEPRAAEVRTGDLARLDGDSLTLLGRRKDMFIRGTRNVYPGLYEPLLAGLPGVVEAAMTGAPDAIGDDRIVVVVVPREAPPATVDARHPLALSVARALPGLVDAGVLPDLVVAAPGLPRSGRGRKLDRRALAALAARALAGSGEAP